MTTLPEGCAHDGLLERGHGQRFVPGVGWHRWSAPARSVLQDRIRALREDAALRRYIAALDSGLSDYEAREEGWPNRGEGMVTSQS